LDICCVKIIHVHVVDLKKKAGSVISSIDLSKPTSSSRGLAQSSSLFMKAGKGPQVKMARIFTMFILTLRPFSIQ
jgi:hypothetical protein